MTRTQELPGWYADPSDRSVERFWNGEAWTTMTREAPTLDDFLGPIEPVLLDLLAESGGIEAPSS